MAKRDGWRVTADHRDFFRLERDDDMIVCYKHRNGSVAIDKMGDVHLTPARAIQFAAKVQEIAARAANKAAKEAKDGR